MKSITKVVVGVLIVTAVVAAGGLYVANLALTGELTRVSAATELGTPLPPFELTDSEGNTHTLAQYKDKVLVLEFSSQKCPWSRGADSTINKIAKEYKDKGVVVLGIDSNPGTSAEDIQKHRTTQGLVFPVLSDSDSAYAKKIGAVVTPEFFIQDKNGNLAYHGALNDAKAPGKEGNTNFVSAALDKILADESPDPARVKAIGCAIKWAK